MDENTTRAPKGKPSPGPVRAARRAHGFTRAGGLIQAQMSTLRARRGYAQARLLALWPEIVGAEAAALTRPVRLAPARGPAGAVLTLAVAGGHAPQVQMWLPVLRERVNAALGPASVGRIQLVQVAEFEAPAPPAPAEPLPAPPVDLGALQAPLSIIGDKDLRTALETLARNVLSRSGNQQEPDR